MKHSFVPALVLGMVAAVGGCDATSSTVAEPSVTAPTAAVGIRAPETRPSPTASLPGVRYQPSPSWVATQPQRPMRVAEYTVPADASAHHATLIVYYFGPRGAGTARANLERWCAQLEQPDGRPTREVAAIGQLEVDGMVVHTLDVRGDYVAETFPGSGERLDEPGHRLLAAIVETPAGPYYLKLLGPEVTVDAAAGDFDAMLASMRATAASTRAGLPPGHP